MAGLGVERSVSAAAMYYKLAADAGERPGLNNLGQL